MEAYQFGGLVLAGLFLIIFGAELLVRYAVKLAYILRVSPLMIGLSIVSIGTSAPELAVSVVATSTGNSGIALGNVVGSNISNILLIIGLSAVAGAISVSANVLRRDFPAMVGATILLFFLGIDGRISLLDAAILCGLWVLYMGWLFRSSSDEEVPEVPSERPFHPVLAIILILVGLALLVIGASWLVDGASGVARIFGVNELYIGLTVVAVGTSLPELATSISAARKGQSDLALGNVVGSNIFNILLILGASRFFGPLEVSGNLATIDLPVLTVVSLLFFLWCLVAKNINRIAGFVLLLLYVGYTTGRLFVN